MPKFIACTLLSIFCCLNLSAQRCGTDAFIASQKDNLKYQSYLKDLEAIKKIAPEQRSMVCAETTIIPVAVHFNDPITCEDPTCLLEAVEAQLAVMNEDFLAANADYAYYTDLNNACSSSYPLSTAPVQGEGSCVQFCLATQNHPPSSALMDGDPAITVGQYMWASDAPEWVGYLNIFVDGSEGGLGVAWLPGNGDGDGFWVTPSAFGGPGFSCSSGGTLNNNGTYNLGRTATHEAGHYLGLPHVFGSCNNDPDSNPPGPIDINDTPNQGSSFFGCPVVNSCADVPEDCGNPQSIFSFMDYTDDPCMVLFTADQSAVINWHANNIPFTDNATLCGGSYGDVSCVVPPSPCENGIQDEDEQDVDCGGIDCDPCASWCGLPFFDEGGPNGAYTNNSLQSWTFCPDTPTEIITVTFTAFDVERNNASACWDYLAVYDGSSTTDPQIGGEFCGNTLAEAPGGGVVTASVPGGCLTFEFDSDGSVTPDGWETTISCAETLEADLSPISTALPTQIEGATYSVWTIKIQENAGADTNGEPITVILPTDSKLNFSYDPNATTIGIFPVDNTSWAYDGSNPGFHVWTYTGLLSANSSSTIGFEAVYDPDGNSGLVSYTATIVNGSGGESNGSNNIDVETLVFNSTN